MTSSGTDRSARPRRAAAALGAVAALAAALLVPAPPAHAAPPANDDFAGAEVLAAVGAYPGTNVDATAEAGEPDHYVSNPPGASVWYSWTSPDVEGPPKMEVGTEVTDFDTVLAVYTGGPGLGDLTLVDSNDDYGPWGTASRLQFDPARNTTYYIAVDGCCGGGPSNATGTFELSLTEAVPIGQVEGHVTDGTGGVDGFCAASVDETGEQVSLTGYTDASGWYQIPDVPAGTDNHIRFWNCGNSNYAGEFFDDSQTLAGATDVAVVEGELTEDVDAVVTDGGTISGTLSPDDPDSTESLTNVCVRATMVGGPHDGFTRDTLTNPLGQYTISGLDGGDYQVHFGGGCGANSAFAAEYYDDAADPADADLVTVTEGATLSSVDAGLAGAPGAISGTVREWEVGPGIPDVCVRAISASYTSPSVNTDANGDYTIPNVPAGSSHRVRFSDCNDLYDYTTQWWNRALDEDDADPVTVVGGSTTPDIDASMFEAATLGGQVTDPNGNPRYPACVDVDTADDAPVDTAEAGVDGRWSVPVPPGNYKIRVYDCGGGGLSFETRWYLDATSQATASVVFVDQGDVRDDLDQMTPGTSGSDGRIVGRVTDDTVGSAPLEGLCVTAHGSATDPAVTDADGRYVLADLPPGSYQVEFAECDPDVPLHNVFPQFWDNKPDLASADPVTVSDGTTTAGIDAQMVTAGAIAGTVTNQAGDPLPDICVTATTLAGDPVADAATDAQGDFEVRGLTTDSFLVEYEDCTYEYMPQWYDGVDDMAQATPVGVVEGQVTGGIDAVLARFGTISGTVTNEAGEPLPDICVEVITADDQLAWLGGTGDDGTYLVGTLDTGDYKVWFGDCVGSYGEEFYDNRLDLDTADLVPVVLGEDTGDIDAVLQDTAPVNTTPPGISGETTRGETLTADPGQWDHEPSVFGYQWVRCDSAGDNCSPITDAVDPTYVLTQDDVGQRLHVTVVATNSIGDGTADSAPTAVVAQDPPPNDDIADRQVLSGALPIGVTGTNLGATREPGEPDHLGFTVGASVWYEWTAPSGGDALQAVQISLAGSDYDTTLSVYDGTPTPFSGLNLVAESDDYSGLQSEVGFAPDPGTTYYIAVDGYYDGSTVAMGTIDLQVIEASGIAGRLTDVNGDPAPGVCVTALDHSGFPAGDAYTDANGDYLLVGLPEGDYKLDFFDCDGRYLEEWYDDKPDYDSADLVHVATGAVTTGIDAELARYGTISGRWTDEQGDPVQDDSCGAYAYDATTGDFAASGFTDPDGYYTIGWLETGSYVVEFSPCTVPYGTEWYDNKLTQAAATPVSVTFGEDTGGIDVVLQDEAPVNTTLPGISGSTGIGDTLTATPGQWEHEPSTFDYQWLRCDAAGDNCVPIGGADTDTYVTTPDDNDLRLRVEVVATNSIGATGATSAPSDLVDDRPHVVTRPVITGQLDVGATLSVSDGTWTADPTSFSYRWRRCDTAGLNCVTIPGATDATYETTSDDAGTRLRVRVTATNAAGSTMAQTDATPLIGRPRLLTAPVVSGTPAVGEELSTTTGTWAGSPTGYTYQWQRCASSGGGCVPIPDTDSATYTTTEDDAGSRLRSRVTATNAVGSASGHSALTKVIGVPLLVTPPEISGLPDVGSELTTSHGTWTASPATHDFQWFRCRAPDPGCTPIDDADAATYTTTGADAGARLRVRVFATNPVGTSARLSGPTKVIGAPRRVAAPTVTGGRDVGDTLTAHAGSWVGAPTQYDYQWLRCDTGGSGCAPIDGAEDSTHVTTSDDIGARLRVRVTAGNAVGSGHGLSAATGTVGVLRNTSPPFINGQMYVGWPISAIYGTWVNEPASYAVEWQRCTTSPLDCTPIPGADMGGYSPTTDDLGYRLRIRLVATNAAGSLEVFSGLTDEVTEEPAEPDGGG